jgi:two-component system chemotaxis response regulator CheB
MTSAGRIRTLVIAQSGRARRFVSGALASDPEFDVVGTAPTGKVALVKLDRLRPDVITFDPEMPEGEAMETIHAIRRTHPRVPIILFSSFTEPGHAVMPSLVAHGASASITTQANADNAAVHRSIREELIPKIKALCRRHPEAQRVEIVAIGISTGGPDALPMLISSLPGNFPVPVVIVQHMPAIFTRLLAERLNAKCSIAVSEAIAGEVLHPGHVWLAPGGHHLIVSAERNGIRLETNQDAPENSCRPSVDPLFRSVAAAYRGGALAVVMTGMGRDGLRGCEAIRDRGGQILVQDQATSVVWGMPGAVAGAGLADDVLPLNALGAEIVRRVQAGRPVHHSPTLPTSVR